MPTSVLDQHPSSSRVAEAALSLPFIATGIEALSLGRQGIRPTTVGGGVEYTVIVSPGAIQLTYKRGAGWERRKLDPREQAKLTTELRSIVCRLAALEWHGDWWTNYEVQDALFTRQAALRVALGLDDGGGKTRSRCGEWSRKSRARMTRRLATLDWSAFDVTATHVPAMVTLTYPGDYLKVCPQGEDAKRQLKAFRSAVERRYGPQSAVWKLERQRRGAPHFHILMMVPNPYNGSTTEFREYRDWLRATWARVVKATGLERRKHEVAGVSVDLSEGSRYSDPQRCAVYFSKHASAAADSPKAYQNIAPDGWVDPDDGGGVGRWWGYWRMAPIEVAARVHADDAIELQRLLRSWVAAQGKRSNPVGGAPLVPRVREVRRKRVNRRNGAVSMRVQSERYSVTSLGGCKPAGFVLVNDAPALVEQLSRALPTWVSEDHPPGAPRPLP